MVDKNFVILVRTVRMSQSSGAGCLALRPELTERFFFLFPVRRVAMHCGSALRDRWLDKHAHTRMRALWGDLLLGTGSGDRVRAFLEETRRRVRRVSLDVRDPFSWRLCGHRELNSAKRPAQL